VRENLRNEELDIVSKLDAALLVVTLGARVSAKLRVDPDPLEQRDCLWLLLQQLNHSVYALDVVVDLAPLQALQVVLEF
jgi:hypothetical protein